jgi:ABC-type multidrug transport system ATPase subunit
MREPESTVSSGLHVVGLTKTYAGGVRALDGINLVVGPGLYGLLGPNGAGKSTLMRTLATLQVPDSGTITLDGVDALRNPDYVRRRLGYLPQQIGAYPGVSGRSLLERFAWLKGRTDRREREREVRELLERVNLSDAGHRAVATYSGGMLRRFGIALALLGSPRLLIVDEPTAGLDPAERNRFHRVLADVAADAIVLLSTHIVEDVENLCQRLSIIDQGRVVAEGTPAELTATLAGRLWARTFSRGQALPDDALHVAATPTGTRAIVVSERPPSADYAAHAPCLEDVYYHALATRESEEAA